MSCLKGDVVQAMVLVLIQSVHLTLLFNDESRIFSTHVEYCPIGNFYIPDRRVKNGPIIAFRNISCPLQLHNNLVLNLKELRYVRKVSNRFKLSILKNILYYLAFLSSTVDDVKHFIFILYFQNVHHEL